VTDSSRRPVIVTGGAGFIGSHVVDRFHAAGERVIVLDDLSTGSAANIPPDVELIEMDLSAKSARETIARLAPALIVHAAAQASVARSTDDPIRDAEVNILGSLNVLYGARHAATSRFVYLNTGGALYGAAKSIPTTEDEPIRPLSPYGLSKRTAEEYLRLLAPRGAVTVSLPLANVYGPRQSTRGEAGVVAIFAERMLTGGTIEIHGDGLQTRDFVYVDDVASAVVAASRAKMGAAVNIGTGRETAILELFAHAHARAGDIRRSALDPAAAAAVFGWRALLGLAEGMDRTLAWYRLQWGAALGWGRDAARPTRRAGASQVLECAR
jgi:UDP-glucose 4-epimerase